ncbi:hypothetical protein [Propioniciclava flava]|uniref:Copper chaperone PCu(A)C n=1 Tax=Propioniciclava flava TaxID=2072026 RepID=A0A4Q2EHM5_9ACTN|nr:hypothetical protein [Propioniciclava flava]RXW32951.1 hypothetical protein C1706_03485 [Propioniciclava flava]
MHLSTPKRRAAHVMIAAAASALLLSGCGFNAQTLQPYTPAEGVNTQIGDVKVRNLVVVSDDEGHGYLSASLVSPKNTALVSVAGNPIKLDGAAGASFKVGGGLPVSLTSNQLVVLTNPTATLTVSSPDLRPGLVASVALEFASGDRQVVQAPVLSPKDPVYATVSPAPSSEATASPTHTLPTSTTDRGTAPTPTATP